ncbi:MAG: hypothetical protein FJ297_10550 [Planctomycetes bacterium]|nr:hypothetical protein [Planctomycetota bacterium]
MVRFRVSFVPCALLALVLAGCANRRGGCPGICAGDTSSLGPSSAAWSELDALSESERAFPAPVLPEDGEIDAVLLDATRTDVEYRRIGPREAACRAARHAPLARLLESEQDALRVASWCDPSRSCGESLHGELLVLQARENRNAAAAQALHALYGLAEGESAAEALDRAIRVMDDAIRDVRRLREEGVAAGMDEGTLARKRLDLREQRDALIPATEKLNSQLAAAIGLPPDGAMRLWPDVSWTIRARLPPLDRALETASVGRADLIAVRRVRDGLDTDTVSVARSVLAGVRPELGTPTMPTGLLWRRAVCDCLACEEPVRRDQIDVWLAYHETAVADEVRRAWQDLAAALGSVARSGDRLESLDRRIAELKILRGAGAASVWELASAEVERIQAEADVRRKVASLRRAEVELDRVQGLLAIACGFGDPPSNGTTSLLDGDSAFGPGGPSKADDDSEGGARAEPRESSDRDASSESRSRPIEARRASAEPKRPITGA